MLAVLRRRPRLRPQLKAQRVPGDQRGLDVPPHVGQQRRGLLGVDELEGYAVHGV